MAIAPEGLRYLERQLPALVPQTYSIEPTEKRELYSCLNVETSLRVKGGTGRVELDGVTLRATDGKLVLQLTGRAEGQLSFELDNVVPCVSPSPNIGCGVDFRFEVDAHAELTPVLEAGRIRLQQSTIEVDVPPSAVVIEPSGCGRVENLIINLAVDELRGRAAEALEERLRKVIIEELVPRLEASLARPLNYQATTSAAGARVTVAATLAELTVDRDTIGVGVDAAFSAAPATSCALPEVAAPATVVARPSWSWRGAQLGVALSTSLLNRGLWAAWRAGASCFALDAVAGLGAGVVRATAPPVASLVQGEGLRLKLRFPEIRAEFGPGGATAAATLAVEGVAQLLIDPGAREARLDLIALDAVDARLDTELADAPGLDLGRRLAAVGSALLAQLHQRYDGQVVVPLSVVQQSGGVWGESFLYVDRVQTAQHHWLMYLKAFARPAEDIQAPHTSWAEQPAGTARPEAVRLVASGSDDLTPGPLLRFQWRVGGAGWSAPSFARTYKPAASSGKVLADGMYEVAVRAVDLNGNSDPQPLTTRFQIDGVAPTVAIAGPIIAGETLSMQLSADDNLTPAARVRVALTVEAEADGTVIYSHPFQANVQEFSDPLPPAGRYRAVAVARDEAGNRSEPASVTFDSPGPPGPAARGPVSPLAGGGGCALGGARADGLAAALLLLLVLALARGVWRRKARGGGSYAAVTCIDARQR
ncbi:MAG: hypothetical protein IPL40_00070 [Proteobacteria bacterium]|nr:hypothetical protein [Pseudomonadota bacterium]